MTCPDWICASAGWSVSSNSSGAGLGTVEVLSVLLAAPVIVRSAVSPAAPFAQILCRVNVPAVRVLVSVQVTVVLARSAVTVKVPSAFGVTPLSQARVVS